MTKEQFLLDSMFGRIKEALAARHARKVAQRDPFFASCLARSSDAFSSTGLKNALSDAVTSKLAEALLKEILSVMHAGDRVAACREKLCAYVCGTAQYQVLILRPAPTHDSTWLRGQHGVTGELSQHLLAIADKNKELRDGLYGLTENPTWNDVWDMSLARYWQFWWYAETFNAGRRALGDCNQDPSRDWYRPFFHAMCAWLEDTYRREIGLPSVLGRNGEVVALMYSTFLNIVQSGSQFPDLEWRDTYADAIADGRLVPWSHQD